MYDLKTVGKNIKRRDALEKVTGKAIYPADIYLDNMAYGYTIRSKKASGLIRINIEEAEKKPGVIKVFTHRDVPGKNHHGVLFKDHEVFSSKKVRQIGEPIALIVAESIEIAKEAANLVDIQYEEIQGVFDPLEAMKENAPRVHDRSNIVYHYKLRKGNIDEAIQECHAIVENTYKSSMVDHCFLQPEAGVSYPEEDGTIVVAVATQYPHFDREEICEALNLPIDRVKVITTAVGGAFGGREDMTLQIHLALAAQYLKRPIKIIYDREESFVAHSKRHPMIMKYKTGALKDGTLHAMQAEIVGDTGAYASWAVNILRKAGVHATGPYRIPNVWVDSYAVYTNNPFAGAMRGFGAAQVPIAHEQQMDELARKIGICPVEIRLRNCFKLGSETATGQILEESVPLDQTILKAAMAMGYPYSV